MNELTDDQKAILAFERQWWMYPGAKEAAIGDTFTDELTGTRMTSTRYYQVLNALIDKSEALEHDPLLVNRLRRLRAARRRNRSMRRLG